MSLDGVTIHALRDELQKALTGSRIGRIYQPSRYEVVINLRKSGETFTLLGSADPQSPRLHLVRESPENPAEPPAFCMLLRKHLERGKILNIECPGFERILHLDVETCDEFGRISSKALIFEIMGRRSNIILINEDGTILDGIIHVPGEVNRYREVLPGRPYIAPPPQEKKNPLELKEAEFRYLIALGLEKTRVTRFLLDNIQGISPLLASEIVFRAGFDPECTFGDIEGMGRDDACGRLWNAFRTIAEAIRRGEYEPTMILDEAGKEGVAFSIFDLEQFGDRPRRHFRGISELLEAFYTEKVMRERLREETAKLNRLVETHLERCRRKLQAQEAEADEARRADEYRIKGELLIANLYRLKKGETKVRVINYYSPAQEEISIEVDPALSPAENAQRFFKKYTRARRGLAVIEERMRSTINEINYLESVKLALEEAGSLPDLREIHEELIEAGYIEAERKRRRKGTDHDYALSKPMSFLSTDGTEILVGKNNRQNDQLTMKMAGPEDYWFHVKNIPGSHVILRARRDEEPSDDSLYEAAMLAAFFSRARNSTNVPVDYTRRKNVRKPPGSKPGMVIYERYNTIFVNPDPGVVERLSPGNSFCIGGKTANKS